MKQKIKPLAVLSKREVMATMILSGIVSRSSADIERCRQNGEDNARSQIIKIAVSYADELLAKLSE